MIDLNTLSKTELVRLLRESQASLKGNKSEDKRLLHALQTHQIELEMQNRELRETRQALEVARDRYADLYDFAPAGYLTLDARGVMHEVNLTAAALLDSERSTLLNAPLAPKLAKGTSQQLFRHLREALQQETPVVDEITFQPANAPPRILRLESRADADGIHCHSLLQDITGQHREEQRQRISTQVFDNALEGIMVTHPDASIKSVNPSFERITGFKSAEAVGQTPKLLHSGHHDDSFYQQMWSDIKTKGIWQGEIWNRQKCGNIYPEWLNISTIHDENGQVEYYLGIFSDISSQHTAKERLHHLAYYDSLTGLPNRWLLEDRLERAIAEAKRNQLKAAVLFLDLDHFKDINDSLGHRTGDELLRQVAERLRNSVREGDTVARIGGDEFVIILQGLKSIAEALGISEKIMNRLTPAYDLDSQELFVTASIGIALYPDDGLENHGLLKNADIAMYRAKDAGRNRYQAFEPHMSKLAQQEMALEQELRRAITHQAMTLHYQPLVDASSGKILGLEALLRWPRENRSHIAPDQIIPMAEKLGLIDELGEWIITTICTQAQVWNQRGLKFGFMSVNMSWRQLDHDTLGSLVSNSLEASQLLPHALEFEITEKSFLKEMKHSSSVFETLHQLGVGLTLDNFGSGCSSFSTLKKLPVQRLKMDRSMIMGIPGSKENIAISSAIIEIADVLGLNVVATGVETAQQRDYLLQHGCQTMQGHLFSEPLPPDQMEALLDHPPSYWGSEQAIC